VRQPSGVDDAWLDNEFVTLIQTRGAAVIKKRGSSSAMSAAKAISDHLRDWLLGTNVGRCVSMAVPSDGSYGVPAGLVFSFPVVCGGGSWQIVQNVPVGDAVAKRMQITKEVSWRGAM
jgi:malate/lactate dehydrogenase